MKKQLIVAFVFVLLFAGGLLVNQSDASHCGGTYGFCPPPPPDPIPSDTTPPLITLWLSPLANSFGWWNTPVNVEWEVSDAESSMSLTGCENTLIDSETFSATHSCSATSAGGTSTRSTTVRIDMTKPVITAYPLYPNEYGWHNRTVNLSFTCRDYGFSGINRNDNVFAQTFSTEGIHEATSRYCDDRASNIANPITVSNIKIDKTAPVITLTTPQDGTYIVGQPIVANWNVTDNLSQVRTSTATAPNGTSLSSALGYYSFSVSANDYAGNSLTTRSTYRVVYDFKNFVAKVAMTKAGKPTGTLNVSFNLADYSGKSITDATAYIYIDDSFAQGVGKSTGSIFKYDARKNLYLYDANISALSAGTHTVRVHISSDNTDHETTFVK